MSDDVVDWLLEGDPAIRWQVLELLGAPPDEVAAEHARVEREGWGAALLAVEDATGLWAGGACFPADYRGGEPGQPWTATMHTLQTLQLSSASTRRAPRRSERSPWSPSMGAGSTMDSGTSTARSSRASTAARSKPAPTSASMFVRWWTGCSGRASRTVVGIAMPRTGRCDRRSTRRSTCSRVCSSSSAQRYLEFAFPYYWRYDVLRALDYFRRAGSARDPRMTEAIDLVRSKRQTDGRWSLDRVHPGRVHFDLEGPEGAPSRWITLRARRVLQWWSDGDSVGTGGSTSSAAPVAGFGRAVREQ